MAKFEVDVSELEELTEAIQQYGEGAGQLIDESLHGEGAQEIKNRITPLIPVSGRTWKKKGRGARFVMPGGFSQVDESLAVTVVARGKYHYLYFPDDGSNTVKHAGNKQFMRRGAEMASGKIIDLCIGKLTEGMT